MFRRRHKAARDAVTLMIEDEPVTVAEGDTVAAALLAAGLPWFRTTAVGEVRRAPWCMMGVCFDCLVEIDGEPNRQACMVQVREGMNVRRQRGARAFEPELGHEYTP